MADERHRCVKCGAESSGRLLISCEHEGAPVWVCARCLPMFIHGGQ